MSAAWPNGDRHSVGVGVASVGRNGHPPDHSATKTMRRTEVGKRPRGGKRVREGSALV